MKHQNHSGHHTDHSGAHMRGTQHHERHANTTSDAGQANDATGYPGEGKAGLHLSDHPTKMELPAKSEGRLGEQANEHRQGSGYGR